jgi:MerR family mercuric resistance operon transcriptional regulator
MKDMTIANFARRGGVGVETVRYYQRRGLLRTPKRGGTRGHSGVRRYDETDVRHLKFIKAAQSAGFKLDEIAELIGLDATDDRPRARELAQQRVKALDAQIAELTAARDALSHLARACAKGPAGRCPILTAFDRS